MYVLTAHGIVAMLHSGAVVPETSEPACKRLHQVRAVSTIYDQPMMPDNQKQPHMASVISVSSHYHCAMIGLAQPRIAQGSKKGKSTRIILE